jgi:hypothetical protein
LESFIKLRTQPESTETQGVENNTSDKRGLIMRGWWKSHNGEIYSLHLLSNIVKNEFKENENWRSM